MKLHSSYFIKIAKNFKQRVFIFKAGVLYRGNAFTMGRVIPAEMPQKRLPIVNASPRYIKARKKTFLEFSAL